MSTDSPHHHHQCHSVDGAPVVFLVLARHLHDWLLSSPPSWVHWLDSYHVWTGWPGWCQPPTCIIHSLHCWPDWSGRNWCLHSVFWTRDLGWPHSSYGASPGNWPTFFTSPSSLDLALGSLIPYRWAHLKSKLVKLMLLEDFTHLIPSIVFWLGSQWTHERVCLGELPSLRPDYPAHWCLEDSFLA